MLYQLSYASPDPLVPHPAEAFADERRWLRRVRRKALL